MLFSCTVAEINLLFQPPGRPLACTRWKARVGLFSKDRRDIFARELLCGARYNFLVVLCKKLSFHKAICIPRRHALGSFLKGPREYRYQERVWRRFYDARGTYECVFPSEFFPRLSLQRITRSLALFLSVNARSWSRARFAGIPIELFAAAIPTVAAAETTTAYAHTSRCLTRNDAMAPAPLLLSLSFSLYRRF